MNHRTRFSVRHPRLATATLWAVVVMAWALSWLVVIVLCVAVVDVVSELVTLIRGATSLS